MRISILTILLSLTMGAEAQDNVNNDFKYIDKYGVTIMVNGNIKLKKPIDKAFLVKNLNSKLIQPERDSLTRYVIQEITKTERRTYRVKITYLFFNSDKRGTGFRNTFYRLLVTKANSEYRLTEFQYEEMEF